MQVPVPHTMAASSGLAPMIGHVCLSFVCACGFHLLPWPSPWPLKAAEAGSFIIHRLVRE